MASAAPLAQIAFIRMCRSAPIAAAGRATRVSRGHRPSNALSVWHSILLIQMVATPSAPEWSPRVSGNRWSGRACAVAREAVPTTGLWAENASVSRQNCCSSNRPTLKTVVSGYHEPVRKSYGRKTFLSINSSSQTSQKHFDRTVTLLKHVLSPLSPILNCLLHLRLTLHRSALVPPSSPIPGLLRRPRYLWRRLPSVSRQIGVACLPRHSHCAYKVCARPHLRLCRVLRGVVREKAVPRLNRLLPVEADATKQVQKVGRVVHQDVQLRRNVDPWKAALQMTNEELYVGTKFKCFRCMDFSSSVHCPRDSSPEDPKPLVGHGVGLSHEAEKGAANHVAFVEQSRGSPAQ